MKTEKRQNVENIETGSVSQTRDKEKEKLT